MPTSLLGLVIFATSVFPGFGFLLGRESRHPTRDHNGFRETVSLIFAGIVAMVCALFAFSAVRGLLPDHTPDVGALLRDPGLYLRADLPYVAAWTVGIVAAATGGAYLAGLFAPRLRRGVAFESAWWKAFNHDPTSGQSEPTGESSHQVHVGCELTDGSYVAGWLWSYATAVEENADRDLALTGPITYRPNSDDNEVDIEHGVVVVASRNIKFVGVSYVETDTRYAGESGSTVDGAAS